MPKTREALERKYKDYSNKAEYYNLKKFSLSSASDYQYFFGYNAWDRDINIPIDNLLSEAVIDQNNTWKRIEGIEETDGRIPDNDIKRSKALIRNNTARLNSRIQELKNEGNTFGKYAEDSLYCVNPENGDNVRMCIDNPPMNVLLASFGLGFKMYKNGPAGERNGALNTDEIAESMGEDLTAALQNYYTCVRNMAEVNYKIQQDNDAGLGEIKENFNKQLLRHNAQQLVDAYNNLVELHRNAVDQNGVPKEFRDVLNNNLSEITEVNIGNVRASMRAAIGGISAQIQAINNGWGVDEVGVMSFLGETKAQIERQKRKLEHDKTVRDEMPEGQARTEKTNTINRRETEINRFEQDFNELYEKYYTKQVNSRREKLKITKELQDFVGRHKESTCLFNVTGTETADYANYSPLISGSNVTDPYAVSGKLKADQLDDIIRQLNEVDGSTQHSSPNFRELRSRIEELHAYAKEHPGEMNREETDEYINKADAVKKARQKYLNGKQAEADRYAQLHPGRELRRKNITEKRMSFVMGLGDRIDTHLENAVGKFKGDVSLNDDEYNISNLARLMRNEARYRKNNVPSERITDTTHPFMMSVYRSLYLEQMRTLKINNPGFTNEAFAAALTDEAISTGAELLRRKLNRLELNRGLLYGVNQRIEKKFKTYNQNYIEYELEAIAKNARNDKVPGHENDINTLLGDFGYADKKAPENAPAEPGAAYGFGRYLNYVDRNEDGISPTEQFELSTGIKRGQAGMNREYKGNVLGVNGDFGNNERSFNLQIHHAVHDSEKLLKLIDPALAERLMKDYRSYAQAVNNDIFAQMISVRREKLYRTMLEANNAAKRYIADNPGDEFAANTAKMLTGALDMTRGEYSAVMSSNLYLEDMRQFIMEGLNESFTAGVRNDGIPVFDSEATKKKLGGNYPEIIDSYNKMLALEFEKQQHEKTGWSREEEADFRGRYEAAARGTFMAVLSVGEADKSEAWEKAKRSVMSRYYSVNHGWGLNELHLMDYLTEVKADLDKESEKYNQDGLNELMERKNNAHGRSREKLESQVTQYRLKLERLNNLKTMFSTRFDNPNVFDWEILNREGEQGVIDKIKAFHADAEQILYPDNKPYTDNFKKIWKICDKEIKGFETGLDYDSLGSESVRLENLIDIYGPVPRHHESWETKGNGVVITKNDFDNTLKPMANAGNYPFNKTEITALGIGGACGDEARKAFREDQSLFEAKRTLWVLDPIANKTGPRQNLKANVYMVAAGRAVAEDALNKYMQGDKKALAQCIYDGAKFSLDTTTKNVNELKKDSLLHYTTLKAYKAMLEKDPALKREFDAINNSKQPDKRVDVDQIGRIINFARYGAINEDSLNRLQDDEKTKKLKEAEKINDARNYLKLQTVNRMLGAGHEYAKITPEYKQELSQLSQNDPAYAAKLMALNERYVTESDSMKYILSPGREKELNDFVDTIIKKYGSDYASLEKNSQMLRNEFMAFHFDMSNKYILSRLGEGNLSAEEMQAYTRQYAMNSYFADVARRGIEKNMMPPELQFSSEMLKASNEKISMMNDAAGKVAESIDYKGMDSETFKSFLETGTKNNTFTEMMRNAEADIGQKVTRNSIMNDEAARIDEAIAELNRSLNLAAGDEATINGLNIMIGNLTALKNKIAPAANNPDAPFDFADYEMSKKTTLDNMRSFRNDTLNRLADKVDNHPFMADAKRLDDARKGVWFGTQEYKNIMDDLVKFDEKVRQAEKEYLRTGNLPATELTKEAMELRERTRAYSEGKDKLERELKRAAKEKASADFDRTRLPGLRAAQTSEAMIRIERRNFENEQVRDVGMPRKVLNRYQAMNGATKSLNAYIQKISPLSDINPETKKAAEEYRQYNTAMRESRQEAIDDKLLRLQNLDLKVGNVIRPNETAENAVARMKTEEENLRKNLIEENNNALGFDKKTERKLLSSACRSLYMEILTDQYKVKPDMNDARKAQNEKEFRKALSFGFADRKNIEAFTKMMSTGEFGKQFSERLCNFAREKKEVTHNDIKNIRDVSLQAAMKKAIPPLKKVNINGKTEYVSTGKMSKVEAENLRRLAKVLGSDAVSYTDNLRFDVKENNPGLKKYDIVKNYEQQAPAAGPRHRV